ncbi:hypothetical protein [Photorhabdus luminescens]|uniref:hypothetical protein n=1 Tax=Photorhabdus luminescens TaxID=29488 RepID=UPI00223EFE32|nr:hypothetical protein [Photorhabdus luminescens]MCW7764321.1 hypothetical protein [Photorhabdus luminescens subsp. venezuelensis]
MLIRRNDLARFLNVRNIQPQFPQCGWDINLTFISPFEDQQNGEILKFSVDSHESGDGITATLSYYSVYCQNCGFIRNFNAEVMEKWLEDNKGGDENG